MALSQKTKSQMPTFKVKKIVDLSLPISPQTPVYPGDPVPKINAVTTIILSSEGKSWGADSKGKGI